MIDEQATNGPQEGQRQETDEREIGHYGQMEGLSHETHYNHAPWHIITEYEHGITEEDETDEEQYHFTGGARILLYEFSDIIEAGSYINTINGSIINFKFIIIHESERIREDSSRNTYQWIW